jgi:prepilin-type N-terminal cleavage/methylation domain-containing protein
MILCLLSSHKKSSGFTLIEILLAISLIGILSAVGITLISGSVDESRYDSTLQEIREIRKALVGDPESTQGGSRSSFGYAGDMGSVPNATQGLNALLALPAGGASWTMNTSARFGLGWNGPYLSTAVTGESALLDSWGRNYVYSPGPPTTITSYGADGAAGGTGFNQDVVVSIPNDQRLATVYGFISNGGVALAGAAQVEIFYPNGNGTLTSSLLNVAAGSQGAFQFNNIPMGYRSLTVFVPSKASPTQTLGPISFTVDKSRFLVPTNLVDTNPSGGGTGTPGGVDATCSNPAGKISLLNFAMASIGTNLTFFVSASGSVSINGYRITVPSGKSTEEISIRGRDYDCSGSRNISPCPVNNGEQATISGSRSISGGFNSINFRFTSSVTSETSATVILYHSLGCDKLNLTGIP